MALKTTAEKRLIVGQFKKILRDKYLYYLTCVTLVAFIALSTAQSSAQTRIHSAVLVIDTSNNASYDQVHWLVRTPYLSIKASNV